MIMNCANVIAACCFWYAWFALWEWLRLGDNNHGKYCDIDDPGDVVLWYWRSWWCWWRWRLLLRCCCWLRLMWRCWCWFWWRAWRLRCLFGNMICMLCLPIFCICISYMRVAISWMAVTPCFGSCIPQPRFKPHALACFARLESRFSLWWRWWSWWLQHVHCWRRMYVTARLSCIYVICICLDVL